MRMKIHEASVLGEQACDLVRTGYITEAYALARTGH
jgi:hypothetical protein